MDTNRRLAISAVLGLLIIVSPIGAAQDGSVDVKLFLKAYKIDDVKKDFPIKAGMTLKELNQAKKRSDEQRFSDKVYNLGWEDRSIKDGKGWVYYWVNGKRLLHCDIVIENNKVKSVWVMPGNAEWVGLVYCRLSGTGSHRGPGNVEQDTRQRRPRAGKAA